MLIGFFKKNILMEKDDMTLGDVLCLHVERIEY
jgi:hypothetical protein